MDNGYLIKLTLALYKITDLFPDKEPLRFSFREKADSVLGNLVLFFDDNPVSLTKEQKNRVLEKVVQDVEALCSFCKIATEQDWVEQDYLLVLSNEYRRIEKRAKKSLEKKTVIPKIKETKIVPEKISKNIEGKRGQEILKILEQKGSAQVRDLEEYFPDVSKRTLRRDFESLLSQGVVRRIGDKNDTGYRLR